MIYSSRMLFFGSRLRVARESRSRRFIYTFTIAIGVWRNTTRGAARGRRLRDCTIRPKHTTDALDARAHRLPPQWLCRGRGRRSLPGRSETVSRVVPMMLHSRYYVSCVTHMTDRSLRSLLTSRLSGPLARLRSPRPLSVGVRPTTWISPMATGFRISRTSHPGEGHSGGTPLRAVHRMVCVACGVRHPEWRI